MSLASQFRKIRKVFSTFNAGNINRVAVMDGRIFATDDRIIVSTPFDSDLSFMVDGETFGKAVTRDKATLTIDEAGDVIVTAGVFTASLVTSEPDPRMRPDGEWQPLPKNLLMAFEALQPFQSDDVSREWACAITIKDGHLFATNNYIFAVWDDEDAADMDVSFPAWVVDYMLDLDEKPTGLCIHDDWIGLRFEDDTEILAFRLSREMEQSVMDMGLAIERVGEKIPEGWRKILSEVVEQPGADTVVITPTQLICETDKGTLVAEIASPTTVESQFSPKLLLTVVGIATHIDLDAAPNPSTWYGNNVRGLIAGKTA